jgi:ElaB/YqjD/DUF883 family membrane-anchored ribosome-binding protein
VDQTEAHILRDIEDTRAAMTAKIGMIQERVDETVEETSSTVVNMVDTVMEQVKRVQNMIENLTSTAEATIAQIQDTTHEALTRGHPGSELITDIQRRPWVMMGTAVLMGYILGLSRRSYTPVSPATAESAQGISPENIMATNVTGIASVTPNRSGATRVYDSTPAPSTDAAGSPRRQA